MFFGKQAAMLALALVVVAIAPAQAIQRVSARTGVIEVRFGYAMPLGEYDGLPGIDFIFDESELIAFDAERVFDDGIGLGFTYGQMLGNHWRVSVGFDFAQNKVKNPIIQQIGDYQYSVSFPDDPTYKQYDLSLRAAYALTDVHQAGWSPFVGVGVLTGLSAITSPGYETDSEFDFGMSLDFGLDVKLWEASGGRSFVALSSINSWNFLVTGERVSHLQIGGGVKYFFRP